MSWPGERTCSATYCMTLVLLQHQIKLRPASEKRGADGEEDHLAGISTRLFSSILHTFPSHGQMLISTQ